MPKRKLIIIFVSILIPSLTVYLVTIKLQKEKLRMEELSREKMEKQIGEEFAPSDRAAIFSVSGGGDFPTFVDKLIVDPIKPRDGEKHFFSIWVKDPQGIEKVTASIGTEKQDEVIELELIEGTIEEGQWLGSWITRDILPNSRYETVFQALNKVGQEVKVPFSWKAKAA